MVALENEIQTATEPLANRLAGLEIVPGQQYPNPRFPFRLSQRGTDGKLTYGFLTLREGQVYLYTNFPEEQEGLLLRFSPVENNVWAKRTSTRDIRKNVVHDIDGTPGRTHLDVYDSPQAIGKLRRLPDQFAETDLQETLSPDESAEMIIALGNLIHTTTRRIRNMQPPALEKRIHELEKMLFILNPMLQRLSPSVDDVLANITEWKDIHNLHWGTIPEASQYPTQKQLGQATWLHTEEIADPFGEDAIHPEDEMSPVEQAATTTLTRSLHEIAAIRERSATKLPSAPKPNRLRVTFPDAKNSIAIMPTDDTYLQSKNPRAIRQINAEIIPLDRQHNSLSLTIQTKGRAITIIHEFGLLYLVQDNRRIPLHNPQIIQVVNDLFREIKDIVMNPAAIEKNEDLGILFAFRLLFNELSSQVAE